MHISNSCKDPDSIIPSGVDCGAGVSSCVESSIDGGIKVWDEDGAGVGVDSLTKPKRFDPLHRLNPNSLKVATFVE